MTVGARYPVDFWWLIGSKPPTVRQQGEFAEMMASANVCTECRRRRPLRLSRPEVGWEKNLLLGMRSDARNVQIGTTDCYLFLV